MVRRWFLVGVMLLAALLVVGCGIPQEEHDAVVAERDAAQAQATTLQSDLTKSQGDFTKAQSDLTATESELASLQEDYNTAKSDLTAAQAQVSQLEDFKTELGSLWTSLDGLLLLNTITLYINASILLDNLDDIYEGCLLMTAALPSFGDSLLESLWEEAYESVGGEWNLYYTPFSSFMEALAEQINSEQEALNSKLLD